MQQETIFDEYVTNPKRYAVNLVNVHLIKEKRVGYWEEKLEAPKAAVTIALNLLKSADREHFLVMFIDVKQKINGVQIVSIGTIDTVIAMPREIFKGAILSNASGIICVHNHPSGDITPSPADKKIYEKLAKAGEILSIPVLDFIVINSEGSYFSFETEGYLTCKMNAYA